MNDMYYATLIETNKLVFCNLGRSGFVYINLNIWVNSHSTPLTVCDNTSIFDLPFTRSDRCVISSIYDIHTPGVYDVRI